MLMLRLRKRLQGGFSALEMLCVLALMGILILFTMPALMDFYQAMRVRTAAQRMVSHMRLCRQVAVARRANVTMRIQGKAADSTYEAWEDKRTDQLRDEDGDDDILGTDDDELWVVRPDNQLRIDAITLADAYHDTTPATANEQFAPETTVMVGNEVFVRFYPNGQVMRLNDTSAAVDNDTLIRVRLDGRISGDRVDRWYVSFNRAGKVATDFIRNPGW